MDPRFKLVGLEFLIQEFYRNMNYENNILDLVYNFRILYYVLYI